MREGSEQVQVFGPALEERAAVAITNSASLVRGTHSRSDDLRGCAYEALAEELEAMARNDRARIHRI